MCGVSRVTAAVALYLDFCILKDCVWGLNAHARLPTRRHALHITAVIIIIIVMDISSSASD
jgi:hypothetical protein